MNTKARKLVRRLMRLDRERRRWQERKTARERMMERRASSN